MLQGNCLCDQEDELLEHCFAHSALLGIVLQVFTLGMDEGRSDEASSRAEPLSLLGGDPMPWLHALGPFAGSLLLAWYGWMKVREPLFRNEMIL